MTIHIIELFYLPAPVIVSEAVRLPNILRKLKSRCRLTGKVGSRREGLRSRVERVVNRGEAYESASVQVEDSEVARVEFSRTETWTTKGAI